jgi:hypothetical protein
MKNVSRGHEVKVINKIKFIIKINVAFIFTCFMEVTVEIFLLKQQIFVTDRVVAKELEM